MRWFVEISPLGLKAGPSTTLCVEAPQWQPALQKARALRGDNGALANFSIELLEDGFRAIDPTTRLRYVVKRAPDDAALSNGASATPAPAAVAPVAVAEAKPVPVATPTPTVPSAVVVPGPGAKRPAATETKPAAEAKAAAAKPAAAKPAAEVKPAAAEAKPVAVPTAPAAATAPRGEPLPSFVLVGSREENPTESSPLMYREFVYAVAPGTSEEEARRLILDRFDQVRATVEGARAGKLINLAVFDHVFHGKPQRRPLVTLAWKDWKAEEPDVRFPARDSAEGPRSVLSTGPISIPQSMPQPPVQAAPSKPAPTVEAPVVPASQPVKVDAAPVKAAPVKAVEAAPVKAAPVKAVEAAPVKAAPVKAVEAAPVKTAPVKAAPVKAVETAPVKAVEAAPVKAVEAAPVKAVEAAPVKAVEAAPAKVIEPVPVKAVEAAPVKAVEASAPKRPVEEDIYVEVEPAAAAPRPKSVPPPAPAPAPAARKAAEARPTRNTKRLSGDDLLTELFEAFGDLHFLRDSLEGAEFVLALTMEKLPSEVAVVSLFDMNKREFVIVRQSGGPRSALCARQPERAPVASTAMRKQRAQVIADREGAERAMDDRWRAIGVELKSLVVAPVQLAGRYLGLIEIANPLDGGVFNEGDGNALSYIGEQFGEFVAARGVIVDAEQIREPRAEPAAPAAPAPPARPAAAPAPSSKPASSSKPAPSSKKGR